MDSNTVERAIRPIALNRKNALFAGSDDGGDNWAIIASLIETAKLNAVDPLAWLTDKRKQPQATKAGLPLSATEPLRASKRAKKPPGFTEHKSLANVCNQGECR